MEIMPTFTSTLARIPLEDDEKFMKYEVVITSEDGDLEPIHIDVTVTRFGEPVTAWLNETPTHAEAPFLHVGFDLQVAKIDGGEKAAVVQLCVKRRCLIFRISKLKSVPESLNQFFQNQHNKFFGYNVEFNLARLSYDYGFNIERKQIQRQDLRAFGITISSGSSLLPIRKEMLEEMVETAFKKRLVMPIVDYSKWNNEKRLLDASVHYACVSAYFCWALSHKYPLPRNELQVDLNLGEASAPVGASEGDEEASSAKDGGGEATANCKHHR